MAVLLVTAALGFVVGAIVTGRPDVTSVACDARSVASRRLPSVVTIQVRGASGTGSGSGEVIRPDGHILTNNHVIAAAANGGTITVVFSDGASQQASLVGRDVATDLAVLKTAPHDGADVLPWGESSKLDAGQPVVALGAPLGLSSSVTTGVVSALGRSVTVPADEGRTALLVSAIQTDAAINPGNSGGALVDCDGKLVGVPTAGATVPNPDGGSTSGSIGIGFAIPSDFARTISDELIEHGSVTHSSFGIQVVPTSAVTGAESSPAGLFVIGVVPRGPAAAAGLAEQDIITELDGTRITNTEQLQALTLTRRPGDTVKVTYLRGGTEHDGEITLGRQPSGS
ncbi:S1C family serine protease [Aquihabitans sp. McL0605]|uniref:S1C family serine protease n=1 Tax=Aquihabitans sp. McL0605 TaxID=3415671 RepID=UPI003CFA18BE